MHQCPGCMLVSLPLNCPVRRPHRKILHLDSSAPGKHSVSRQLSADIVAQLHKRTPTPEIRCRDLAARPLPHWAPVINAADHDDLGRRETPPASGCRAVRRDQPHPGRRQDLPLRRQTARRPALRGKRVIIAATRDSGFGKDSNGATMDFQKPCLRAAHRVSPASPTSSSCSPGGSRSARQRKEAALVSAHENIASVPSPDPGHHALHRERPVATPMSGLGSRLPDCPRGLQVFVD